MSALVKVNGVHKNFTRGSERIDVLQGVTLDIPHGDFLALMGPSGSGKTTLLNLLGGLDRPSSGSVEIAGTNIGTLSGGQLSRWRSHHIGFVFQLYNLLPVLTSTVSDSILTLSSSEPISPTKPITYTVGAMALEGISISGTGDVVAPNLSCGTFKAAASGSGTFAVGGRCDGLELSIAGSGDFDGQDLTVASASVSIQVPI